MKTLLVLSFVFILSALTKSYAQLEIPNEDLIMGKSGVWLPQYGSGTDGVFGNAWVYYNDNHLLYHYETPKNQHTIFYLIKKRQGGDGFCGDSCITINCYDSAQSVYLKNKSNADSSYPVAIFTINYGAGEHDILENGREVFKHFVKVEIANSGFLGSFETDNKKSFKALIPALLAKNKVFEYETSPLDDVPFSHASFNWSKIAFETHGFSFTGAKRKQDSLNLVERKRHYDSLFYVPESVRKRIADSLYNLALNNHWVEFLEVGDTTKEPQASIIKILKNNNVGEYKYHFYHTRNEENNFYVVVYDGKSNWSFYRVNIETKKIDGPHTGEMQYVYPNILN